MCKPEVTLEQQSLHFMFGLSSELECSVCWIWSSYFCFESRDQPSRGPAVALTPPLLNSISASSRSKEVEWLLFNLTEKRGTNDEQMIEQYMRPPVDTQRHYLPKNFFNPLAAFLVSEDDGSGVASWDFLEGTPAKSRCSVPLRSVSAVKFITSNLIKD